MNLIEKIVSALSPKPDSGDEPDENEVAIEIIPEDTPVLIVSFPHPNQPEFNFVNWDKAPSIGALERMTHHMFRAAQAETMKVRREFITQSTMTSAKSASKRT